MNIVFDPNKEHYNIAKHGVSLSVAASIEWDLLWVFEDTREAYGEMRWIGYAPIGEDVYCIVFTEENDTYRIISLRPASSQEIKAYARHF